MHVMLISIKNIVIFFSDLPYEWSATGGGSGTACGMYIPDQ